MSFDDIFDQEKWPHCTLFAISLAVTNACADHNVRVTSLDVRTALFQYEDIYKKLKTGFYPESGSHNQSIFLSPPLAAVLVCYQEL